MSVCLEKSDQKGSGTRSGLKPTGQVVPGHVSKSLPMTLYFTLTKLVAQKTIWSDLYYSV